MQTELTTKAAEKGKSINLKKGQFLSPNDVEKIVLKIKSTGNNTITERELVLVTEILWLTQDLS